jgi:hypothetical protein
MRERIFIAHRAPIPNGNQSLLLSSSSQIKWRFDEANKWQLGEQDGIEGDDGWELGEK